MAQSLELTRPSQIAGQQVAEVVRFEREKLCRLCSGNRGGARHIQQQGNFTKGVAWSQVREHLAVPLHVDAARTHDVEPVARITLAPPRLRSSAAGSCAWLSM